MTACGSAVNLHSTGIMPFSKAISSKALQAYTKRGDYMQSVGTQRMCTAVQSHVGGKYVGENRV